MNFAVLQFPGSNCDQDVVHVLSNVLGHSARLLWHKEHSLGEAEAGLLPGAVIRNRSLQFRCEYIFLKTITADSPFTRKIPPDKLLRLPIAHGEGCYFADEQTLAGLTTNNQILWRYVDAQGEATEEANPNGSLDNIAGICNEARNVAGLMPHPERASEAILGCADGRLVFEGLVEALGSGKRSLEARVENVA